MKTTNTDLIRLRSFLSYSSSFCFYISIFLTAFYHPSSSLSFCFDRSLTHIFCFVSRHCYRINLSLQYLRFSKRTKYCHVAYCFISHLVFNMCVYDICLSLDVTHLVRHVRRRINEISALYLYAYDLSTIPP